jgi:hypothetical protein
VTCGPNIAAVAADQRNGRLRESTRTFMCVVALKTPLCRVLGAAPHAWPDEGHVMVPNVLDDVFCVRCMGVCQTSLAFALAVRADADMFIGVGRNARELMGAHVLDKSLLIRGDVPGAASNRTRACKHRSICRRRRYPGKIQ